MRERGERRAEEGSPSYMMQRCRNPEAQKPKASDGRPSDQILPYERYSSTGPSALQGVHTLPTESPPDMHRESTSARE